MSATPAPHIRGLAAVLRYYRGLTAPASETTELAANLIGDLDAAERAELQALVLDQMSGVA